MMFKIKLAITISVLTCLLTAAVTHGDEFEIGWYAVAGGGESPSVGGEFSLSGTIGQPYGAAGPMSGGEFEAQGGFWVAAAPACACLADVNGDGDRNAADIQGFVDCLLAAGTSCDCADVDGLPGVDFDDLTVFVNDLLDGSDCP